eukprot:CAMPEP_0117057654 /NCGR_PEP_ID=MMETSP0472-20121206/40048_1 /TAXON_ID=693140 ORGANISM="Tiarina fusus, Strain LIS" /NCGR_SAMPLE_ID=MMETSP0472 /ASSEMBLY_ACC=CAM_ASM_000603 /LENGTH=68 /DNA_ID=CAMNT_0004774667 /DNA_START=78 /DNA_END=281 /DNA_ORIENTATION=-
MKPAWNELGDKVDSDKVVIGDVDCTAHGSVCQANGVRGYPTIKWFPAGSKDGQPYQSGRSVGDLKKFV